MAAHNSSLRDSVFNTIILLMLITSAFNVYKFTNIKPETVTIDTTSKVKSFWEQIVRENPTYRDGYLVLSQIKGKEGSYNESAILYSRASVIDPFVDDKDLQGVVLGVKTEKR